MHAFPLRMAGSTYAGELHGPFETIMDAANSVGWEHVDLHAQCALSPNAQY
jgi:hypothetical protein